MPPRVSLATLLGIVSVIALGLAGMLSTSRLWLTLASTVTLILLLAAILASWQFSGIDRAFWVGFALFGWIYLIMVNWDWVGGQLGHDLTVGISEAAEWLLPEVKPPATPPTHRPHVACDTRHRAAADTPCRPFRQLPGALTTATDQNWQFRSN
jgi:hypothetical protein